MRMSAPSSRRAALSSCLPKPRCAILLLLLKEAERPTAQGPTSPSRSIRRVKQTPRTYACLNLPDDLTCLSVGLHVCAPAQEGLGGGGSSGILDSCSLDLADALLCMSVPHAHRTKVLTARSRQRKDATNPRPLDKSPLQPTQRHPTNRVGKQEESCSIHKQ